MYRKVTEKVTEKVTDKMTVMPLRFGNDLLLWACWLYYEEGMTQSDVARVMGVSRASVNTYLSDARNTGIVDITIRIEKLRTLSVAKALKDHFGLQDCLVIPSEGGERTLIDRLGRAGALVLEYMLQPSDTIAVGWGRTIFSVAESAIYTGAQDVNVIQALGSINGEEPYSPEICARKLAEALCANCIPISAPALVSSVDMRRALLNEPLIAAQLTHLTEANRVIFGISSLRPNSTIHSSGFFDDPCLQRDHYNKAVGAICGRLIDDRGHLVENLIDPRIIGITLDQLLNANQRIAVAGGFDKVPAILATLRGGYANVLVTDMATGRGILTAEGQELDTRKKTSADAPKLEAFFRQTVKKLINKPSDAVKEALEGAVREHSQYIVPIGKSIRALQSCHASRPGKVGLVIGGGAGHEPCFLGYVGQGMADAVAIGNIFASPPPGPILECTLAVDKGAGVLYIHGNYSGDIMNFDTAADLAKAKGVEVRRVITTDDIASSEAEDHEGRRGVAGNVFIFKIAGAACDRMMPLNVCEALVRRANARTYTMGVALEPCSLPETRRPSFSIGENEMEVGVGIHGELGIERRKLASADETTDLIINKILSEMSPQKGDRVALLVNSLGGTPLMELYIINRRVRQRLHTRGVEVHASWTGNYCTSLDMVGVSISLLHLDEELQSLIDHPCRSAFFRVD